MNFLRFFSPTGPEGNLKKNMQDLVMNMTLERVFISHLC